MHILSHIPPGNGDCWTIFSREFAKIINRFESTVAAQFYGHTHNDEYKIFYDFVELDRAVNVAFVAPSLTTSSDLNPGYRTYTIDGPRPGSTWVCLNLSKLLFKYYIQRRVDRLYWTTALGSWIWRLPMLKILLSIPSGLNYIKQRGITLLPIWIPDRWMSFING